VGTSSAVTEQPGSVDGVTSEAAAEGVTARRTYVGARQRKHDGDRYLTGKVLYTADITLPAMAHVAIVRSPHAHARILGIDVRAAEAQPAVIGVLTGAQAAEVSDPIPFLLDPAGLGGTNAPIRCLALDKVVYAGQPLAAVVAETPADAAAAARLVEVRYEVLPAVLDARAALADGAPLLYEDWSSNVILAGAFGDDDFDAVAAGADHVLAGELRIQRSTPSPMETRAYIADWHQGRGELTWYGTAQNPHPQRYVLATALRMAEHLIRVVTPPAGGAFGLKMHGHPEETLVAVLSRMLGRPVKWVESRAECLLQGGREQLQRFRVAYDDDGRVRALHDEFIADHGAMAAGAGWGMAFVGANAFPSGYDIQHCRVDFTIVATNKPPSVGMKPFGKDSAVLVLERVMDLVAEATGLDPVEVRRRNWVRADQFPYTASSGLVLDSGDYHAVVDRALELIDYPRRRVEQQAQRAAGRLIGVGIGFEMLPEGADVPASFVTAYDSATVRVDPSGHVTVLTGATSPGGGNDTAFAQIVADRVGLAPDEITVVQGDTALCPYGTGNISSRGLVVGGGAVALAADDVAEKLRAVAAGMLGAARTEIVLGAGLAAVDGDADRALPLAAVAKAAYTLGYVFAPDIEPALESTRTYQMPNVRQIPDERGRYSMYTTFSNAVHISVVEVDAGTGTMRVLDHAIVHDCGTQVNPLFVEGQVRGGVVMGIGAAVGEAVAYDVGGRLVSDGFKQYLLQRAVDLPPLGIGHVETPSPFSAFGAKGVGESGYAAAAASVMSAVNDALRPLAVSVNEFPLSPPRLLGAMQEATR
jgi:carbon-monoxide dehydrogenase large subunit